MTKPDSDSIDAIVDNAEARLKNCGEVADEVMELLMKRCQPADAALVVGLVLASVSIGSEAPRDAFEKSIEVARVLYEELAAKLGL